MSVCGAVLLPSGHGTQTGLERQELSPLEREFRQIDECCSWSLFYEVKIIAVNFLAHTKPSLRGKLQVDIVCC